LGGTISKKKGRNGGKSSMGPGTRIWGDKKKAVSKSETKRNEREKHKECARRKRLAQQQQPRLALGTLGGKGATGKGQI